MLAQVVGWFVTHYGFNGLLASLSAGVPMYASSLLLVLAPYDSDRALQDMLALHPFTVDQPANALHTVANLGVAYELLEVRTGAHARKPVFRTGAAPAGTLDAVKAEAHRVLDLACGADGAQKREKARVLSGGLARAWDDTDEGVARIALQRFLSKV